MHYLAQWRMQIAARMLGERGSKVATIANAVGYESVAAFSRSFKKHAGASPDDWRKQAFATRNDPTGK